MLHVPIRRVLMDKGEVAHIERRLAEVQVADEPTLHKERSRLPVHFQLGHFEKVRTGDQADDVSIALTTKKAIPSATTIQDAGISQLNQPRKPSYTSD